jgi:hypothetical protein
LLELVEEALDAISLLVEISIVGTLELAVTLWRDDNFGARFGDAIDKVIGIVSFVADGGIGVEAIDQVMSEGDIVALAGRANQADRKAERLGGGVNLGAQAAARPAQTLGIRPPLTLRAPAAC